MSTPAPLESARRISTRANELAEQIERERALPADLVEELRAAGLLHLCLPRSLGGQEAEPAEMVACFEQLARGDGATGWCSMIASTSGLLGAFLPPQEGRLVYDEARNIPAGVFAPRGKAERTADGYVISGRWPFGSGIGHAHWVMGGCIVAGPDGPELTPAGGPDVRLMLMPVEQVQVLDTWSVAGLCGTGSNDFAAEGVEVPAPLGVSLFTDRPREPGALYAFPLFGLLALGICAVALGIAAGAIDELSELAAGKRPAPGARALAERSAIQGEVARASAKVRAARSFVIEQATAAYAAALDGATPLSERSRADLRLAATHGTWAAAEAVTAMYHAGGGGAIYSSSPLQRRFRDVNVATQHIMVAPPTWELSGRVLLGVPTDTSQL